MALCVFFLVLAQGADLRNDQAIEVAPGGALSFAAIERGAQQVAGDVALLEDRATGYAAARTHGSKEYLGGLLVVVTFVMVPRYFSTLCCFVVACQGRERVSAEQKQDLKADGTVRDVSFLGCCSGGPRAWAEVLFCADHLWVETAAKFGHMTYAQACLTNFALQFVAFWMIATAFMWKGANTGTGMNDPKWAENALNYPCFYIGMAACFHFQYLRSSMRMKMAKDEASAVSDVGAHCCLPLLASGCAFSWMPAPCGCAVYQEAEYVECYHKPEAGAEGQAAQAPEQQPLVE